METKEYKKEIGKEADHINLKGIILASTDVNSEQLIRSAGLDKKKVDPETRIEVDMYKSFVDDIDRRYRVEFGTLEIKTKKDSDDPMGLHAVEEGEQKEDEYENINGQANAPDAALDAVTKGKSKGNGNNDG